MTDQPAGRKNRKKGSPAKGETKVWLCSMGLAVGMAMILFLLGLILFKGIEVFWPKDIARIAVVPEEEGQPDTYLAQIVQKRERDHGERTKEEWQLFIGNKDAYGLPFKYIDADAVEEVSYPEDVIVAERMEYGDSIFVPVALVHEDGTIVEAEDFAFRGELEAAVEEASDRREEIDRIEKHQIGAVNRKMADLQIELRKLERDGSLDSETRATRRSEIEKETAALQKDYEVLAAEAGALREKQDDIILRYRLAGGEEREQPAGDIVSYYRPNELSFWDKVGLFLSNFWRFLSEEPREANTEGGIFPAIFGTFAMTVIMSVLVTPFGVIAAIYLREYARQGLLVRSVRISVNNLAGVPSIVFGVFGLGFFVYFVGGFIDRQFFSASLPTPTFGTGGIFWASLTLALMTLPVVIVATEEALAAVPRGVREAALACGASKWQVIQRVVLPSATPGVLTGVILAMARGAGEVAPLMLVGVIKMAPALPIDTTWPFIHADRKFMHLGFHIYDLGFQSPDSEAAKPMVFATTFLLILLVVVMNLAAIMLRNRLRKKYAVGTF